MSTGGLTWIGKSADSAGRPAINNTTAMLVSKSFFIEEPPRIYPLLHGKPCIQKDGVIVLGTERDAVDPVIPRVLQRKPHVGPRPARCFAHAKRDVGKLCGPAVAIGAPAWKQEEILSAPDPKVLSGENNPVVVAESQ